MDILDDYLQHFFEDVPRGLTQSAASHRIGITIFVTSGVGAELILIYIVST
jgi:hypothetical protein